MQATVHDFVGDAGSGELLLDDGRLLPFDAAALDGSGLRQLRVGQRVSIETTDTTDSLRVHRIWIVGIGSGEIIR